jgi:hypothetical protein
MQIDTDPDEEIKLVELAQRELQVKERLILPFDPGDELKRAKGDPGADGVENEMDLETSEPMLEEQALTNIDNLVQDIEENWEDELFDVTGGRDGR